MSSKNPTFLGALGRLPLLSPLRVSSVRLLAGTLILTTFEVHTSLGQDAKPEAVPQEAERPALNLQVLDQKKINLGNRSIIMNRVVPPVLPQPPPPPPQPTAEQVAAAKAAWDREPHKKFEILFLSATVYDHNVTEIRWYGGKREFRVFSNIDFNYLRGAGEFETEDTVYMLLMGIGNETTESIAEFNQYAAEHGLPKRAWKQQVPAVETFSQTRAEYMLIDDKTQPALAEDELAPLDALHTYYDANKQRLIEDSIKLDAANAERAQWLKEHPPIPKDTIINFWFEQPKRPADPRQEAQK